MVSTFDMKDAFHYVEEESRKIKTFSTHLGLYRYRVLNFGLNNVSEIFQRVMKETVLSNLKGVGYIDDVMVYGKTQQEHDNNVEKFLARIEEMNIELNDRKCHIDQEEVKFMGHSISPKGIMPAKDKLVAIEAFKPPTSKEDLKSFLGLVNYVGYKFKQQLAHVTAPLRKLLGKNVKFAWKNTLETRHGPQTFRISVPASSQTVGESQKVFDGHTGVPVYGQVQTKELTDSGSVLEIMPNGRC